VKILAQPDKKQPRDTFRGCFFTVSKEKRPLKKFFALEGIIAIFLMQYYLAIHHYLYLNVFL
jgi:hypothetical protein